jgi:uncharacterized protein YggE
MLGFNLELIMRILSFFVCPALAALALLLAAPAAVAGETEDVGEVRSVTVTASGEVTAEPDQARITSGVTTEAATAAQALSRNSELMQKVIDGLKADGIEAKDIQTTSFRVEPRYTRPREGEAATIDGYRVTNQVEVLARNLDRLGAILDRLVSLGANETAGLSFEVSQAETLRDEARKAAVANARRRAELYAAAAGAKVGEVLTIQEGGEPGPRPVTMARAMKAQPVPIERGTETLDATVTVTWALK